MSGRFADADAGWPAHRQVLGDSARVLRPGGVLVINTCSHAQTEQGFWTFHLIPRARAEMLCRLMPLDALETALSACGIARRGRFVPSTPCCRARGVPRPPWPLTRGVARRRFDWALVEQAELADVERRLRELDRRGEVEAYVAAQDAMRPLIGQITLLCGIRR